MARIKEIFVVKLTSHIPPDQLGRYLAVGLVNTVFGYGSFALLTAILDRIWPHGYILAGVISTVLNITFAYFNYKLFVFKTKGNYLREWLRTVAVYSGGIAIGVVLLPITVLTLRRVTGLGSSAPYVAGALLMGVNIIYSFLGHKKFSFRDSA